MGVYMRSEIKSTRNWVLTHPERNSLYITFYCGQNETKFGYGAGPRKTDHSVKASHPCLDEINACADVSFRMISLRVVFTWYFITQNEILFLLKWS